MDAWRILNDITFIRLNLEYIYMNEEDEFIEEVIRQRSLFGFILEYNFPSVDAAPASLKTRVRVHAKHFSGNTIHFQHKRVLRIKMVPELVNLWKRAQLLLTVYAKLNTLGKYSVKKMGTCQVPLHDLTIPPFIICRDFLFLGAGFSGSALIKIDLGSHVRQLMERLEWMRHDTLPQIGSATRARSRSCKKELAPTSCQLTPVIPQRRAFSSSPPPRFSKITNRVKIVLVSKPVSPLNLTYSSASNSLVPSPGVLNDPHIPIQGLCPTSPSYRIRLTVYSARRLPFDFNSRKEAVVPATYLTVTGEDGRTLSSPIRTGTLHPEWNWTETFNVSRSRQNLVVKLWRRCIAGSDKVIGFISLHLPPTNPGKSEYEMSDLSVSNQAPLLTLSLSYDEPVHEEFGETPLLSSSPSLTPSVRLKSMFLRTSPRLQNMTREEVYEKLRKNISELERMTARLKHT